MARTEQLLEALDLWRDGDRQTQGATMPPDWQAEYRIATSAIAIVLVARFGNAPLPVTALVEDYYRSPNAAMERVVQATMEEVTRESGHLLNYGVLEDAAYWLAYRALVLRATQRADAAE